MDFTRIEKQWQGYWNTNHCDQTVEDDSKPKFYVLSMFPYPSGSGLHVGHPMGYIAADVFARYKRLQGFNVLHPMGFDSFGLPAEQYAVKTGQHPAITTAQNIATYTGQLNKIGLSYDWGRCISTADPNYYKWTQWIFLKLFNSWYNPAKDKAEDIGLFVRQQELNNPNWKSLSWKEQQEYLADFRLAYLADVEVNWCAELNTVLSNEEVHEGFSERGNHPVIKRNMRQWCLRITAYGDRLLKDLDRVEVDWSDSIKTMQRNWIETLRDAVFSRQRFWGEPIPIYFKEGMPVGLPETELPLVLPDVTDFTPALDGQSPLAKVESWTYNDFPLETDTMPGWAGSSWYYLRYMDNTNDKHLVGHGAVEYWKQVDLYIGGAEHTVGHLLYVRFWTKFLFDLGIIPFDEPVRKLVNQGMILGENGEKMSKRGGNVVNPDDVIAEYGADTFRVYEMFLGDLTQKKPWNTTNISGSYRFLQKYHNLFAKQSSRETTAGEATVLNQTITAYQHDIEAMGMNTCVSTLMKAVNFFTKQDAAPTEALSVLCRLLAPFAPHLAEETWRLLGNTDSVFTASFPSLFVHAEVDNTFAYPLMVDGKKREEVTLSLELAATDIETYIQTHYSGVYNIDKIYVVPGRIINIVTPK